MQKNKLFGIICATLTLVLSSASHAQDGVQTVDALLQAENKAVLEKLKLASEALSPVKSQTEKKIVRVGPSALSIKAVYGLSNSVRTDLTYEGQTFIGLVKGGQVGPCSISEIRGMCIALKPSGPIIPIESLALSPGESLETEKASSKASRALKLANKKAAATPLAANICPSACWSAPTPVMATNTGGSIGVFPSASDAPRFSPPVLTGNQRTLTPVVTPTQGVGPAVIPAQPPAVAPKPIGDLRMSTTLSGFVN
jgi:hypothetical protein